MGGPVKKFLNDPNNVVPEVIEGFARAHRDIVRQLDGKPVIVRATPKPHGTVALVSGGGSGHEPLHAGFVGEGMLDAAVAGAVFTSPTPDPVEAAARAVDTGAGVLFIVKNYTGDVLNFETAADLVQMDGIQASTVIVNDDVAVQDSTYTAGRRGVAGTVFVEKIAGALAEQGASLDEVTSIAQKTINATRSFGVALRAGTVPHIGSPSFELAEDEIEFGVGIHGEPGRERIPLEQADAIVDRMMSAILEDLPFERGDRVAVLVNGMGATPLSELYIVYRRVAELLDERGIAVERSLVGDYVTSLDMAGGSISLLRLDDELLALYDAPVRTAALVNRP